ncbi:PucR family transcriptional regulator [Streptomyces noursei ATCC 11455]|uniref:PucR family transcriptional regulator n=1 Tax=Streptomyces noursei TaxID=1971 RepID=UPI00081C72AD|nr:PucR family transcriptional regulator [Streptomyces noursei ATCC 11455]
MEELWPTPSARVCELIRALAERMLPLSDDTVDMLWQASQGGVRQQEYVEDPVLAEADRRLNKTNTTHWLFANLNRPGRRVQLTRDPELLIYARDLVLRGLNTDELASWRSAQQAWWERWIRACFTVTEDLDELRELVEVSGNSMTTYVDDLIAAVGTYVDEVRSDLGLGAHAERHATVQLLLEGSRMSRARAEEQLGYSLGGHHTAAIVWVEAEEAAHLLERAAEHVMRACGATRRLTLVTSTAALWLWMPVSAIPAAATIDEVLKETPGVRTTLGRPARDVEGFRSSHLDAAAAQRLLARMRSPRTAVRYEDVHLVDLLTADLGQADQFVSTTLGELSTADPVLRHTVSTFLNVGFNVSHTAEKLFAHRNTIDRRLARARALLPRPLEQDAVSVAAALMLVELRQDRAQGS